MLTVYMCTAALIGYSGLYSDNIGLMMQKHANAAPWCAPTATRASISAIQRPKNAHSIYVYSDLAHSMFRVAGGNCISNNHYNRYRGSYQ